jgi:hypothetical protein
MAAQPLAREIVPSEAFKQFLTTEVPHLGVRYADVFNRHIAASNVAGVDYVIKQYLATAPGTTNPPAVDLPTAAVPPSPQPDTSAVPQVEDLQALKREFQQRKITPDVYRQRLAAAEAALRSMSAAPVRH